jgi:hypothetical protein
LVRTSAPNWLMIELFNLLVNPLKKDYALSWHRDDVKASATPEEEEAALKIKHDAIQWNAQSNQDPRREGSQHEWWTHAWRKDRRVEGRRDCILQQQHL